MTYASFVVPDHQSGFNLFAKSRHAYGRVSYMATVRKLLYLSGQTEQHRRRIASRVGSYR